MRICCLSLIIVVTLLSSCTSGERIREAAYLESAEPGRVGDPTEWDRFEKICETQALGGGARHMADMDDYPKPGCRQWWLTRRDATISFDVGVPHPRGRRIVGRAGPGTRASSSGCAHRNSWHLASVVESVLRFRGHGKTSSRLRRAASGVRRSDQGGAPVNVTLSPNNPFQRSRSRVTPLADKTQAARRAARR